MRGKSATWRDVTIVPPKKPGLLNITRFSAQDGSGAVVPLGPVMISSRAFKAMQTRLPAAPVPVTLPGHHIWAGMIYGHFGHFITETLPRLLSIRADLDAAPHVRIAGFAAPGVAQTSLAGLQWFLDHVGIDPSRIDVMTQNTRLPHLTVPPPPFPGRYAYDRALLPLIERHGLCAPTASGERIFVSRSRLGTASSRVQNIAEIEALYASHGYSILYPEQMSPADQVARITACAVLAGENGSALHWSLYSRHIRQVQSIGWSLALQRGICRLHGQDYVALRNPWLGAFQGRAQSVDPKVILRHLRSGTRS